MTTKRRYTNTRGERAYHALRDRLETHPSAEARETFCYLASAASALRRLQERRLNGTGRTDFPSLGDWHADLEREEITVEDRVRRLVLSLPATVDGPIRADLAANRLVGIYLILPGESGRLKHNAWGHHAFIVS